VQRSDGPSHHAPTPARARFALASLQVGMSNGYFPKREHPGATVPGLCTSWCRPTGRADAGRSERDELACLVPSIMRLGGRGGRRYEWCGKCDRPHPEFPRNLHRLSQDFHRGCPRPSRRGCPEGERRARKEYRLNLRHGCQGIRGKALERSRLVRVGLRGLRHTENAAVAHRKHPRTLVPAPRSNTAFGVPDGLNRVEHAATLSVHKSYVSSYRLTHKRS